MCAAALAITAAGCTSDEPIFDRSEHSLAVDGRWMVPEHVSAIGDQQFIEYTGAGAWVGESGCGGGLLDGTSILREYIMEYFPQTYSIGGYSCRPIVGAPNVMSVHATGRALDIMIPTTSDGQADNGLGDPIAHWLMVNAEHMGIQYIIWDRSTWAGYADAGAKEEYYSGEHPHHDHLHVELSVEAAALNAPWFSEEWAPPDLPDCDPLPPEGGVLDDTSLCLQLLGPTAFWRVVEGEGHGGRLLYTNAFESETPSNWARWQLELEAEGVYEVEIHGVPGYSIHQATRYQIEHAGEVDEVVVDESSADGWQSLGVYQFAAGPGQSIALFDNAPGPVAEEQRIAVDAIRLTPSSLEPGGGGDGRGDGGGVEPEPDQVRVLDGGCSAGGGPAGGLGWLLVAAAPLWRRRTRRG